MRAAFVGAGRSGQSQARIGRSERFVDQHPGGVAGAARRVGIAGDLGAHDRAVEQEGEIEGQPLGVFDAGLARQLRKVADDQALVLGGDRVNGIGDVGKLRRRV